jgi:hypothetical protein
MLASLGAVTVWECGERGGARITALAHGMPGDAIAESGDALALSPHSKKESRLVTRIHEPLAHALLTWR